MRQLCDMVLDRGHKVLFTLSTFFFSLTPAFLHKVANLMGLQSLMKKKNLRGIFTSFLCTYTNHVWWHLLAVFVMGPSERHIPTFFSFNYKGKSRSSCVTCFGIMSFLASGTACGAVRLIWICGRGKMPKADRN